jgi:hypothetical protein
MLRRFAPVASSRLWAASAFLVSHHGISSVSAPAAHAKGLYLNISNSAL